MNTMQYNVIYGMYEYINYSSSNAFVSSKWRVENSLTWKKVQKLCVKSQHAV